MRRSRVWPAAILAIALAAGCGPSAPVTNGYKPGVEPGASKSAVEDILGKPSNDAPFSVLNMTADVMTYSFGQVLVQNDRVIAITVANDPSYVGPFGITLGIQEDAVKALFAAHKARRTGHRDAYDVIVGETDTRTRDLYDVTDGLMIEMAAANPNDPLAPFNVISITRADDAGMSLLTQITQAKVGGNYPGEHVYNYVTTPWST
ncbi:MAG TPA: hypothetical protein VEJ20_00035 [Candidatus Eremiobacteraceae bacterium]|nr:hypothetical protein [Candidatus Eremiobacteraceae bacterium]